MEYLWIFNGCFCIFSVSTDSIYGIIKASAILQEGNAMTLDEIKALKKQHGYTNKQLAELSGLPLSTVQKVLGGTTASPRYRTIELLSSVFREKRLKAPVQNSIPAPRYDTERTTEKRKDGFTYSFPESSSSRVADMQPARSEKTRRASAEEPSKRYPRQGSYTLEDYLALPDEQRVELIDGVFYDMSAPTIPHQMIGGAVYARILNFLAQKKGTCMPFIAPTDVQLDRDNRTIVQPDVMVVCDRSKITPARIFGAPDFVLEVLSPSTKMKDILIKTAEYKNAGVREYWMADPKTEKITKLLFTDPDEENPDGDIISEIFSFDDRVPISIFNDELKICFREIADNYSFLNS